MKLRTRRASASFTITAAMLSVAALQSCAGPIPVYQPRFGSSAAIGYAEEKLGERRLRVRYSGPARTRVSDLEHLALRRAAELSLLAGYRWFSVLDRSVDRNIYVLSSRDGERVATYRGGYSEWRRYWRLQCLARQWQRCEDDLLWLSASRPRDSARIEIALTVELVRAPLPHHSVAIDAQAVLDEPLSNPH